MASRQATKSAPVGSFNWISNERALIRQHEEQDIEDFTFAARNDLEWLNEHMADIFERNQVDMAELLKTPGRLRGKTPGTARKRALLVQGHEPAAALDSSDNLFYHAPSSTRKPSKSPARSVQVLQDAQPKKLPDQMKNGDVHLAQAEDSQSATQRASQIGSQISIGDSGIWSASSNFDSQQIQQLSIPSQRISVLSGDFGFAPSARDRDSTYRTAPEDSSDPPHPQSPVRTEAPVLSQPLAISSHSSVPHTDKTSDSTEPSAIKQLTQEHHSSKLLGDEPRISKRSQIIEQPTASSPKTTPELRRSGRLAERLSSPIPTNTQILSDTNDVVPPSSPPVIHHQEIMGNEEEEDAPTLPAAKSLSPSPVLNRSIHPETSTRSTESTKLPMERETGQTPEGSPAPRSSSEPPTPEVPVIRKSILNFAALPAREPLTSKKKSLGVKTTRDSHVEQIRLNNANRASWMNRGGNGKSLGASSRPIERTERTEDDIEETEIEKVEVPLSRKRKSESTRDDSHKKPKGNRDGSNEDMDGTEDLEEDSNGETSKAMALHNKTSTQRLHDKIQQLGKLNASREARSFPSTASQNAGLGYPELPQEPDQVQPILKRTKSDPQGQFPHTENPASRWTSQPDEEEEWIPVRQESKRQLTRSNTEGETESQQTIALAPIAVRNMAISESAPTASLKSVPYPPKRHLPGSPLKSSFSDDWIKTPASPTKPPNEGTISAVKAHTSSVFKKAKEMLLKSSVSSTSVKIETMNPSLRSWQGGSNLRQQMIDESGPDYLSERPKQLYPDLGSAIGTEVEAPAHAKDSTLSMAPTERLLTVESATEPTKKSQTRGSRDTRELTPEEEETLKVQKSKAIERAEREEKLREREERLRQVEEELRIEKEEKRREEEELQRIQEQQRKQKEEQARKEKEESRRRQEERLKQEKEELKRRQQEELRRQQEEARKTKENPSSFQDDEDYNISDRDEDSATDSIRGRITSSAEPERPPSRLQKGGSRFQKTGDKNKPLRPGTADKNLLKPKPGPVSISVGTASQREMQSQRSKPHMPPTTSTLVAALKQSFEPPGLQASTSQTSLTSSVSSNSLRVSNPTGSKQLKSLTAAANQLKKEQEDKERKAAMKRDIERRRQENQRKTEEEARRARQKQIAASTQKTLSRTQTVANLRQTSEEPERRIEYKPSINSKPTIVKTAVKRGFQPETSEVVYQQEGAKKRKTGEYDERPYEMAPPIRQAKETMPKSTMPHGYSQAPYQASSAGSSMLRPPGAPMPQVEGVKYSKDKIRFAAEATAGPSAGPPSAFKTPGAKSASKLAMLKTPAGAKDSPIYQNGEFIELPEIPTDSEDEEDDYVPKDTFSVPQWAESPELRALLRQQQAVNPEEIFGPMAKLDMDAIFQNKTEKQAHRFRARTSSANWSGADRLTAAEIAADHEARQKMIAQGGWKYQPPS